MIPSVPPSPQLERKLKNTENLINSGNSHLVDSYAFMYPDEYVNLETYYRIKNMNTDVSNNWK